MQTTEVRICVAFPRSGTYIVLTLAATFKRPQKPIFKWKRKPHKQNTRGNATVHTCSSDRIFRMAPRATSRTPLLPLAMAFASTVFPPLSRDSSMAATWRGQQTTEHPHQNLNEPTVGCIKPGLLFPVPRRTMHKCCFLRSRYRATIIVRSTPKLKLPRAYKIAFNQIQYGTCTTYALTKNRAAVLIQDPSVKTDRVETIVQSSGVWSR